MKINNTGSLPNGWKELLEKNLRLPANYSDDLINHCLESAISYVEKHLKIAIVNKNVVETFVRNQKSFYLTFVPTSVSSLKINNEVQVADEDYTLYSNGFPSFIRLEKTFYADDILEIDYHVSASGNVNSEVKNAVIMLASLYFNNPEGIPHLDLKRINIHLKSIK
jgi:hypothetical protein